MGVRVPGAAATTVDLSPMTAELQALAAQLMAVDAKAQGADDRAANAQQMVRNRDPKLEAAQATADQARAEATTLAALAATVDQRVIESQADRLALHAQLDALTAAIAGKASDASLGTLGVAAILLGGKATLTVPLATPMATSNYRVRISHSAAVDLTKISITNVQRATTAVTFTLTATGVALAAGTVVVLAVG